MTYAILDDWQKEAAYSAELTRTRAPARVTYRTDESLASPGIRHDRAYWISGIRGREAGYVDLDATSYGCGLVEPVYDSGTDSGVGPQPLAWTASYRTAAAGDARGAEHRLTATLANVAALTIDSQATCLSGKSTAYELSTDGPAQLHFSDERQLVIDRAGTHSGGL